MNTVDIKNKKLAPLGKIRIEWASSQMPVLATISNIFKQTKPLKGIKIGACLHVTAETANLMLALKAGGAIPVLCASNPLSTQDDVAASLVSDFGISVLAINGEDKNTYYKHLKAVLSVKPQITMDDGADLVNLLHQQIKSNDKLSWEFYGSSEETTTGVIRLAAMEKNKALKVPVVAVNDSQTKHLFDNRYGTGQSTIDGIIRATNILLAGRRFVVVGFGWCGRGLASRARGMGAHVIICETNPIKALEAVMEGYEVMTISQAVKIGDIFVTVTGNKSVISYSHLLKMKDGAIVANSGHFDVEIDLSQLKLNAHKFRKIRNHISEYTLKTASIVKKIYILAEGRLVNLVAAEGHPSAVMDLSFANQALASRYLVENKGKLQAKVYRLPAYLDRMVATLKLKSIGVRIDKLTTTQKKYLSGWTQGT